MVPGLCITRSGIQMHEFETKLAATVDGSPLGLSETDDFIDTALSRPLQIVYRDENYVAVFKPAGLIVHRSKSTLAHEPVLLQRLRDQLHCHLYPVHRLDRPTAGLILFGLSSAAAAKMVELFTNRLVAKYYQALVCGQTPDAGLIDQPLGAKSDDDWAQVNNDDRLPQEALTQFETLARFQVSWKNPTAKPSHFSLLEIKPMTGRSHQIRRHLNHIGHPVIGDHRHGYKNDNEMVVDATGVVRMLLTSMRLDFRHPYSGELHSIVVGRGSGFDRVIATIEPIHVGPAILSRT